MTPRPPKKAKSPTTEPKEQLKQDQQDKNIELQKKLFITIEKLPSILIMAAIVGPLVIPHKRIQETTGCKVLVRGGHLGDTFQSDRGSYTQQVRIEGNMEQTLSAERVLAPLLKPASREFIKSALLRAFSCSGMTVQYLTADEEETALSSALMLLSGTRTYCCVLR